MSARIPTYVGVVVFLLFFFPSSVFGVASFIPLSVDTTNPIIGDTFVIQASASGVVANAAYYLKCRIGPTSGTTYTEGQTLNTQTNKWLDDTSAWIDMPQVAIGGDGQWQGSLSCRIKSSAVDEAKQLVLRACLNVNDACGTSFQSINFVSLSPRSPTPTNTPTPTTTNTPTQVPTNTQGGTNTPTRLPTPTVTLIQTQTTIIAATFSSVLEEKNDVETTIGAVLGEEILKSNTMKQQNDVLSKKKPYITTLLFVGIGCALIAAFYAIKIHIYSK